MKKLISLLLVLTLMACLLPAAVAEAPEGYPEVVEGIDFGGKTLYISPYFEQMDINPAKRAEDPDEDQQATYDYEDWIMKTYNVNVVFEQVGSWEGQLAEIQNFLSKGDTSELRMFIVPSGFVGNPIANGWYADWKNNELIDLNSESLNKVDVDFMTKGDKTYGISTTPKSEPRACVFFNKKLLQDAGIDPESIYDMQKDGTWTFAEFEKLVAQMHKDNDADGVIDIYGITGSINDLYINAVFANGGSFFDTDENGKLVITAGSDNTNEALAWVAELWKNYGRAQNWPDEEWNFFVDIFKAGKAAFCIHQTYAGYNEVADFTDMQDQWGCVAIPKGPKGTNYLSVVNDNIAVVPSIYDAKTTRDIEYIYYLWTQTAPGVDDSEAWIGKKYEICRGDTRAVDETYAMLREPEHAVMDKSVYLGDANTVLGTNDYGNYLWGMLWSTPASLLEGVTPAWEGMCAVFNGDKTKEEFDKEMAEKKAADEAAAAAAAEETPAEETKAE